MEVDFTIQTPQVFSTKIKLIRITQPPYVSQIFYIMASTIMQHSPSTHRLSLSPSLYSMTMSSSKVSFSLVAFSAIVIFLALLSSTSLADDSICQSTPDPSSCKGLVQSNKSANVYDYGRSSLKKSIATSRKFLSLVDKYLSARSNLSAAAVRALQDCRFLGGLNLDYLLSSSQVADANSKILSVLEADDVQTLLSALLTNQQTCLDGLQETSSSWSVKNGVSTPLSNDTKLYRVSLSLFTKGWVPKQKKGKVVSVSDIVTVNQDGSGNFTTINDAIAVAPNNTDGSNGYFVIYIQAGVYEEYVSIAKNKKYLMMIGDGINQTVITGNRNVVDGWTTFNSATFAVVAQGFVAVNITFRNTAGAAKHQAVALRSGADLSTFYLCLPKLQLISPAALSGQFNAITAQGRTDPNQNTGTSIHNCVIRAADDLAASNGTTKTYLGRPWKEYSRTVYMQSNMGSLIYPSGWSIWSGDFALSTLYYAEYNNTGPGSNTSNRVTWSGYHVIGASDAANFTVGNFLLGGDWLPQTGVPYTGGLL
ncbi:putative pectinesterase/pectinesterase inhibitor 41 [Vitis vinifera]|uniref:pectinesterase n=1 Tax=Vitis vinifera TaxID=29760 RepID=A0A438KH68_VITVI|nr:putative pectinesterase/pectinesterase inhibitor 41 [Vitis vinifera]